MSEKQEDNQRRICRVNAWVRDAEAVPCRNEHIRFLFYWIAYEAAYKQEREKKSEEERKDFHKRVARRPETRKLVLQSLREHEIDIIALLQLRQADRSFWTKPNQLEYSNGQKLKDFKGQDWEKWFKKKAEESVERLGGKVLENSVEAVTETLDDLFLKLGTVRNQIVHGGSAGEDSYGRTQVTLGLKLLAALIPIFRDCIDASISQDWGKPPFPRVGSPDDHCLPPWD